MSGGGIYVYASNNNLAIIDSKCYYYRQIHQSNHPYSSGYPISQNKPYVIYKSSINISSAIEIVLLFDSLTNIRSTLDSINIYDNDIDRNLIETYTDAYPGIHLAPATLPPIIYIEFHGPDNSNTPYVKFLSNISVEY